MAVAYLEFFVELLEFFVELLDTNINSQDEIDNLKDAIKWAVDSNTKSFGRPRIDIGITDCIGRLSTGLPPEGWEDD